MFFTDQQRPDSMGAYGNKICRTPVLDTMANEGTLFENAFTCSALCTPARISLLTGTFPHTHGAINNADSRETPWLPLGLSREIPLFNHALTTAGYRCGHIGKSHFHLTDGHSAYGFEGPDFPAYGNPYVNADYFAYLKEIGITNFPQGVNVYKSEFKHSLKKVVHTGQTFANFSGLFDWPVEASEPYYLAERAIAMLTRYADEYHKNGTPFFLTLNFWGPHHPCVIPEPYFSMYNPKEVPLPAAINDTLEGRPYVQQLYRDVNGLMRYSEDDLRELVAKYYGYVTLIDDQMGRVIQKAKELGVYDDAMTCFSSDHGCMMGAHRMMDKGPFMYDDTYRIPMVIRTANNPHAGRRVKEFANLLDMTPTFLDFANLPVPAHYHGRSLLPFVKGATPSDWPKHLFAEFHGHMNMPLIQRMIRTEQYKYVHNSADYDELYDMKADPNEMNNLSRAESHRNVLMEHKEILSNEMGRTKDPYKYWYDSFKRDYA